MFVILVKLFKQTIFNVCNKWGIRGIKIVV